MKNMWDNFKEKNNLSRFSSEGIDSQEKNILEIKEKLKSWEIKIDIDFIILRDINYFLNRYPFLKKVDIKEYLPNEKMKNVVEVMMAEWATTISSKKENVLATYWAVPCIIFWWYSEWRAFLSHLSKINISDDFFYNRNILSQLFFSVVNNNKGNKIKFIIAWWNNETKQQQEEIINYLKMLYENNIKDKDKIKVEFLISDTSSLAIDSTNWKIYTYDPLKNPYSKKPDKFTAMFAMTSNQIHLKRYEYIGTDL